MRKGSNLVVSFLIRNSFFLTSSKTYKHTVPADFNDSLRLKDYLKGLFSQLETRSAVKRAFHKKQISVNGETGETGYWVKANDVIAYERKRMTSKLSSPKLNIVYEDSDVMVVYKPPGLSSSGNQRSLQYLLESVELIGEEDILDFPLLVHRLDKATEGLMIAAKTMKSRRKLSQMLKTNQINKQYVLLVEGWLPNRMYVIKNEIDGKTAITEIIKYHQLKTKNKTTAVWVKLITGRTHQIRKHFQSIGHPLVGDSVYNQEGLNFRSGLLLCAYSLKFDHPITQKSIDISMPIPKKIYKYLYKKVD